MKPHIKRWRHSYSGLWVWAVFLRGRYFSTPGFDPDKPDYLCTQLSIVKDVQRGLALQSKL